ncbi:MAG: gamma-glutamylcyclotransferase [Eubacterium sp.]|nr:gamma-glutamylcyclotransferase [Eubacterium sp.]
MKDEFFTKKKCDRCGKILSGGRIMSMFNTDCICMKCKEEERKDPDYHKAQEAELEQVKQGNINYPGIRG